MKLPEPQHMLGLRAMGKKGLDAYEYIAIKRCNHETRKFTTDKLLGGGRYIIFFIIGRMCDYYKSVEE
jgi:hypothetical protein